jgi:hypothetical protein
VNSLPAFARRQQNDLQVLGVGFGRRPSCPIRDIKLDGHYRTSPQLFAVVASPGRASALARSGRDVRACAGQRNPAGGQAGSPSAGTVG